MFDDMTQYEPFHRHPDTNLDIAMVSTRLGPVLPKMRDLLHWHIYNSRQLPLATLKKYNRDIRGPEDFLSS